MIADLKPYPAYKDSGVPWLGEVPSDWNVAALRALAVVKKGRQPSRLFGPECPAGGVPYLSMNYLRSSRHQPTEFAVPEPGLVLARTGATLLLWEGANAGEFLRAQGGVVSSTSALVHPRGIASDYFFYACQVVEPHLRALTVGMGIPHVDSNVLKNLRVSVPPPTEQAAIVRFLDHADRRIRRYIRAKQKLIKLLEELKAAIIHRAVTRGLDPNVRLKPSGVEWLGDVPEHWEMRKIRQCGEIFGGLTPSMADRSLWDGDIPWVTPKDMKRFAIADSSMRVSARALEVTTLRLVPAGSVLLVVRGMILGRRVPVAQTIEPVTINQDMKAIIPGTGIDAGYLAYRMDAAQATFVPLIDEAGHGTKRFPTERWKDVALGIPPIEEQRQIVSFLDQASARLTCTTESAQKEIELLREYRTRLIADVVTGKLDVREAAAKLPEEPPEEPLEGEESEIGDEAEASLEEGEPAPDGEDIDGET